MKNPSALLVLLGAAGCVCGDPEYLPMETYTLTEAELREVEREVDADREAMPCPLLCVQAAGEPGYSMTVVECEAELFETEDLDDIALEVTCDGWVNEICPW